MGSASEVGQGWAHTRKWVRGGLILGSGSGVGSYSEVGWAQTQKWVRGGLILRSGLGVGSYSEVGWAQTQKWVRGRLILRSGVGSDSEVGQGWAHTQSLYVLYCVNSYTQSYSHTARYTHMCICYLTCDLYCNCCLVSCVPRTGHMSICLPPTIDCRQQDYTCNAYVHMHTCSRPSPTCCHNL